MINVKTGVIDRTISDFQRVVSNNPSVNTLYADSTTGKFDIIAMIQAANMSDLHHFIVEDLQKLEGITSTITEVVTSDPIIEDHPEKDAERLKCYILMTVEVGKINEVLEILAKARTDDSFISRVACTTGEYDIIARIESTDVPSLYSFISQKIHVIEGINSTMTHIVAREISY